MPVGGLGTHDDVTSRSLDHALAISVRGHLTGELGAMLLARLSEGGHATGRHVVVNMSEMTGLDSPGAEALLDAYVATALRAGALVVSHAAAPLQKSLRLHGVIPVIEVFEDEAAAVSMLRSLAPPGQRRTSSSLADVVMMARPNDLSSFEFVRIAALRTAQLIRGCVPRVPAGTKPATTAMREVAAGMVRATPERSGKQP